MRGMAVRPTLAFSPIESRCSADEQVAEAIARVVSRYAVDLTPEIEVNVPRAGIKVTYVAKAAMRFSSHLRAARRARGGSTS
jgi:hypothetical protein